MTDRGPLLDALGVELDEELLTLALTHRSYAYENGGLPTNERLEFLGDSVLGVIVTERLYRDHPDLPEGQLAKLRASVVNMHALAGVAARLVPDGLGAHLYLGRGEELTGGRDEDQHPRGRDRGADRCGVSAPRPGDRPLGRAPAVRLAAAGGPLLGAGLDWKTSLQELTAASDLGVPEYRIAEEGPDHSKLFTATAVVSGRPLGSGDGRTKKEAEQKAAQLAWRTLTAEARRATAPHRADRHARAARGRGGPAGPRRPRRRPHDRPCRRRPPTRGAAPHRGRRRLRGTAGGAHDHRGPAPGQVPVAGAGR